MPSVSALRRRLAGGLMLVLWALAAAAVLDAPKGAAAAPETFVRVQRGDTLYGIARRFGTTVSRLRSANGLRGDLIRPGQRIRLSGVAVVDPGSHAPLRARAPLRPGRALRIRVGFGEQRSPRHRKVRQRHTGIDLEASVGVRVRAAARGVVRFLGDVTGFGRTAIVEHDGGWRTLYCPLDPSALAVEEGEVVRSGQLLGRLGRPVETERSGLHFEIRRGEKAVDPRPILAR